MPAGTIQDQHDVLVWPCYELLPEGEAGEKTCAVALVGPGSSPSPTSLGEGSGCTGYLDHLFRKLTP